MIKNPPASGTTNFTLNMKEVNNYFPFGMKINSRTYTAADYSHRYGFNGMTEDNELKGEGNSLDFGARFYDPRVGRFLSLDPMMEKYPVRTPYLFAANDPILYIDENGLFEKLLFEPSKYIEVVKIQNRDCPIIKIGQYMHDIVAINSHIAWGPFYGTIARIYEENAGMLWGLKQVQDYMLKNPQINFSLNGDMGKIQQSTDYRFDGMTIGQSILFQTGEVLTLNERLQKACLDNTIEVMDIVSPAVGTAGFLITLLNPTIVSGLLLPLEFDQLQGSYAKLLDKTFGCYSPDNTYTLGGNILKSFNIDSKWYDNVIGSLLNLRSSIKSFQGIIKSSGHYTDLYNLLDNIVNDIDFHKNLLETTKQQQNNEDKDDN